MGKAVNIGTATRWLLLQNITSSCRRNCHQGSASTFNTSFPIPDAKKLARNFHDVHGGGSLLSANSSAASLSKSLTEELEDIFKPDEIGREISSTSLMCIYKVPSIMLRVNRKAYEPNIVSIGPYHHGVENLQEMEKLKRIYIRRLIQPNCLDQLEDEVKKKAVLDDATKAMEKLEAAARSCYSEESKLSSKEFVKMMLIDGFFIIGLLRDSAFQPNFEHTPSIIQRWMLPTLRQDLIKLENQLPLFVLRELFELTKPTSSTSSDEQPVGTYSRLEDLALRFFKPLLRGHADTTPKQCQGSSSSSKHFLDLFHKRISPDCSTCPVLPAARRGKQTKQVQSIQELREAGVKFRTDVNSGPLDITFSRRAWGLGRVLTIPRIHINDHRGTLFRNLVAFEKCHPDCHQDVTSYLFFLDGIINSAKDVGLLHYNKVLQHSLGSNRRVAKLVNNLCKEVGPNVSHSYLYNVVGGVNEYYSSKYGKIRGFLVHHHFSSWLVGISTLGACLALYLTIIQAGCGVANARNDLGKSITLASFFKESLLLNYLSGWELLEDVASDLRQQVKAMVSSITEKKVLDNNDLDWPYNIF